MESRTGSERRKGELNGFSFGRRSAYLNICDHIYFTFDWLTVFSSCFFFSLFGFLFARRFRDWMSIYNNVCHIISCNTLYNYIGFALRWSAHAGARSRWFGQKMKMRNVEGAVKSELRDGDAVWRRQGSAIEHLEVMTRQLQIKSHHRKKKKTRRFGKARFSSSTTAAAAKRRCGNVSVCVCV